MSPLLTMLRFREYGVDAALRCGLTLLIGVTGSVFVISLFEYLGEVISFGKRWRKLAVIGSETLAIYIFQTYFIELPPKYLGHLDGMSPWLYYGVVTPFVSLAVIAVCHWIIGWIKRSRWLSFLLLGKKLMPVEKRENDGCSMLCGKAE